jgi:hypothetical protein
MAKKMAVRRRLALPANAPPPSDITVGLGENVINDFLRQHYAADPSFYIRETDPIWQAVLPAKKQGDTERVLKVFGRVIKPGIAVHLAPTAKWGKLADADRFRAWWALRLGQKPNPRAKVPPNVVVATTILLTLEFTNRKDPKKPHRLTYQFTVAAGAYLSLENDEAGNSYIRARDWDISIDSLGIDENGKAVPLPGDQLGHTSGDVTCEQALADLRDKITDLFDFGANFAISRLASDLTTKLPLPPLTGLVKAVDLLYDELRVEDDSIKLSAWARPTQSALLIGSVLDDAVSKLNDIFTPTVVSNIVEKAPAEPEQLRGWMLKNLPEYSALGKKRLAMQRGQVRRDARKGAGRALAPTDSFWLTTNGAVFDILAKKYLSVQKDACRSIFHIDIAVAYGDVSVCYRLHLANPRGGIDGKNVFMGCDVDLAGWGTASACIRNPCGNDPCASYSLGLGLRGPLSGGLALDSKAIESDENGTRLLKVAGFIGDFPGVYIIGLPGILDGIVNKVLNAATSFLFEALLNGLLRLFTLYIVSVSARVPGTHVKVEIRDFSVDTAAGNLTLGIKPTFKVVADKRSRVFPQ